MKWKNRRASTNTEDRRGKKAALGGGLGFLGIAVVIALLGGDPSYFLQEGVNRTIQSATSSSQKIPAEKQEELKDFVSVTLAETEDIWHTQFKNNSANYKEPILVFFTGNVSSACGFAQSAMGPFYCPLDEKIYIDLDFFYDLAQRHDAPGDFAQAYVIAHEVGHHVQNILGILDQANQQKKRARKTQANKISVRTELMADCIAGIWAHHVGKKGLLEEGDIQEALNAATQIGDDRLQKKGQGYVVPDSFTHGSGKQRYEWFQKGFLTGTLQSCGITAQ